MNTKNQKMVTAKDIFAKSVRKYLHPDLKDHDVESISIVLICHLMVEFRINELIYKWKADPIPYMGSAGEKKAKINNDQVKQEVEKIVTKINFYRKVNLIKPLAIALWGKKDAEEILGEIKYINKIRNKIFHNLEIKEVKIKEERLTSEKGLDLFVDSYHQSLLYINDLIELIEN